MELTKQQRRLLNALVMVSDSIPLDSVHRMAKAYKTKEGTSQSLRNLRDKQLVGSRSGYGNTLLWYITWQGRKSLRARISTNRYSKMPTKLISKQEFDDYDDEEDDGRYHGYSDEQPDPNDPEYK